MKYNTLPLFSEVLKPEIIEEGSKRVKLNSRTIADLQYATEKVWDAYVNKDDENPKKATIMVVDPTGGYAEVPVYYLSNLNVQGGVFQLDINKPRNLYNLFIVVNPEESNNPTKNNTYQILYHELQHLMDLNVTSHLSQREEKKYDSKSDDDSMYWGHDFEFRAYANEFLEGLYNQYNKLQQIYTKEELSQSLNTILDYFGRGGQADDIAKDVMYLISSETEEDTDFPHSIKTLALVKKHNPNKWNVFLKMLYNTVQDLKKEFDKEPELVETIKKKRKYSQTYCEKTPCHKMGFSQKASCRPYKNCYRKN
jgi:hypothetical protein